MGNHGSVQGCRKNMITPTCVFATDRARFSDYSFQWRNQEWPKSLERFQVDRTAIMNEVCGKSCPAGDCKRDCNTGLYKLRQDWSLPAPEVPKVCVVGWSHSYHLIYSFNKLNLGHHFVWAKATYPTEIDYYFLQKYHKEQKCTKFIIGVAQWPPGYWGGKDWPNGKPYLFRDYSNEMFRIINLFQAHFPDLQVYMRSIHHNPIMGATCRCKPIDWRSPSVMDSYKTWLRKPTTTEYNSWTRDSSRSLFGIVPMTSTIFQIKSLIPRHCTWSRLYLVISSS
jgi:hypothetical protein